MLMKSPIAFRKRRGRIKGRRQAAPPVPAALTLVSAQYADGAGTIWLGFDRAIDIADLDGTQIIFNDGTVNGQRYTATGAATLLDPSTVEIGLVFVAVIPAGDMLLTASATTGITALDDGGTWGGVTDLVVPFA